MRHVYGAPLIILLVAVAYSLGCGTDASPDASPTGSRAPTVRPQTSPSTAAGPLYIAVGDSLSYGSAASDPDTTSFVALVRRGFTIDMELLNLGVPGYTSADLLSERELDIAIGEISGRLNDGIEGNEVEAATFEIGGNDLLSVYFDFVIPETCTSVDQALANDECVNALSDVLDEYSTNLDAALSGLRAADPDLPIFVLTLYNPFSGRDPQITRIGDLAIEGEAGTPFEEGINDIIRDIGPRYDVHLVEIFPIFDGRAEELVAFDLIHPNDEGYALISDAVLAAMSQAGLPVAVN
jgi:lysophospholipase L1-like esterase